MQVHKLIQGSPEWLAHRARYLNASDAPAMMGVSPYETRDQLIHRLATGITPEIDAITQRRFDDGHRFEALARPLAEKIIGETLYPVVATEGKMSASSDGLTMDERTNFEHKSLNDELRAIMVAGCAGDSLPIYHRIQMEQQHMVFRCEKTLFMATKWEGDTLLEDRHCWYTGNEHLAVDIAAGWVQLEADVAAYEPPEATAPAPTGRAPETLPALLITVKGEVTDSNLANFKEVALAAIRSVNRELSTDQHFADAEKAVKWCSDIEERVAGAKQHALSQTVTIDQLFKALDDISAEARQTRLDLKRLVEARKISLKTEMLTEKQTELGDFLRAKNAALGRDYMPRITADFASAIHGKKNFDSMRSALNGELARAKIEANAVADKILRNLNVLADKAKDHDFLFNDKATLVQMENDHFALMVDKRISDHQAEQKRKDDKAKEDMRIEAEAKAAEFSRAALVKIQGIQNQLQAAQGAKPAAIRQLLADTEAVVVDVATFGVHSDLAVDAKRQTMEALFAMVYHPNGAPKFSETTFRDDGQPIMLNDDGTRSIFCDLDEEVGDAPALAAARDQAVTGTGVIKMTAVLDGADDAPVMLVERIAPANVMPMRAATPPTAAPAPASAPAHAVSADGWQPAETMPKMPDQWIQVQEVNLYRFLPYKVTSTEYKRGKKGRWQRHNGYGFENSEPPVGQWRIGEETETSDAA